MGKLMKNGSAFRRAAALVLAMVLVVAGVNAAALSSTAASAAKKKTTVKVSTQKQLNKALKNKSVKKIVIETNGSNRFKVRPNEYGKKKLIINAPNAKVNNKGVFKAVVIKKADTFAEYAQDNVIKVSSPDLKLNVKAAAEVKDITFKGVKVKLNVEGSVGQIFVAKTSTLTVKGTDQELPVIIEKKAAGSKIDSSVPVLVTASVNAEVVLQKGAEGSVITAAVENAVVTVDNRSEGKVEAVNAGGIKVDVNPGGVVKTDSINDDKAKDAGNKADTGFVTGENAGGNTGGTISGSTGENAGGTAPSQSGKDLSKEGYTLKWQDEFNGTSLNRNDWNVELHEAGWVNSEWQNYVDSDSNIYVKDGKLHIKAIKDGDTYTSGRINTQNKHDFTYGLFEVTAKVPAGKGFLPAFWMMPTDENLYGQWPRCGEIDCMEVMGQEPDKVYGTIHYGNPHREGQETYKLKGGSFSEEYHTFSCEWEPGKIRWYMDGILYHTENDWFSKTEGVGTVAYPAPFDQPFYMILNLAVGGSWVGFPDETTSFENAEFVIDSVRAYQKSSYDENVKKPEKEVVLRNPDANGNYINNGSFSVNESLTDDVDWKFMTANGGEASAEIADSKIKIATTNQGNVDYSVQLVQANVPFEKGATYKVSFDAKASAKRNMNVAIKAPDYGYTTYWTQDVELDTEPKNYSFDFKMTSDSDGNGRLEYNMGSAGSTADIEITNVKIEKAKAADPNEKEEKTVLADGNYIYNSGFQEGENSLGYWEIKNNANAEIKVVKDGTDRYLKVSNAPGSEAGALTIGQSELALVGAAKYELSFNAKADKATTIQVTVAGKTYPVAIDTTDASRVVKVDLSGEPLKLANSDITFAIGNVNELVMDNVRLVEDALIKNGSFDAGLTGFEVYAYASGMEEHVIDSLSEQNAFDIKIKDVGDADWKIQLKQSGIKLEKDKYYHFTYKVKSSLARKIKVMLQQNKGNWTVYSGNDKATVELAGDNAYKTLSYCFKMKDTTDENVILSVCFGAVDGQSSLGTHRICMDDFKLVEVTEEEAKKLGYKEDAGETGGEDGTKENLFGDPEFQKDYWANGGWGCVGTDNGKANCYKVGTSTVIEILEENNPNPWDIQFMQEGIKLEKGREYKMSFNICAKEKEAAFDIVLQNKDGFPSYGTARAELKAGESKEVSATFIMEKDTDANTVLAMKLGKLAAGTKLTISNPTLIEIGGTVTQEYGVNLLKNPQFTSGENWLTNTREGDTVSFSDKKAQFTISKTAAVNLWDVELKQKDLVYEEGETYQISFNLDTTQARKIQIKCQHNGENDNKWSTYFIKDIDITKGNNNYQIEAPMNSELTGSDGNAIFAIDMGSEENNSYEESTHTIKISNISMMKIHKQ